MNKWTESDISALRAGIAEGRSHKQIAIELGRSTNSIRSKSSLIGEIRDRFWSQEEIEKLKNFYEKAGIDGVLLLDKFAKEIGKHKTNVSRKARQLGLSTSRKRKKVDEPKDRRKFKGDEIALRNYISSRTKQWIKENGHPRGSLGMKHTEQTRSIISEKAKKQAALMTPDKQAKINLKIMKTKLSNGTCYPLRPKASWKAAWHEIGGKRNYYRSNWESNYAYYLEWLKCNGHIQDWAHEPKTFWFEGIKRGTLSYLPDFVVIENDGTEAYHEVKGWMDDRSKTKIDRMKKYYPNVKLVLIDNKSYMEIRRKVSGLVPGWKDIARDKRGL